MKIGVCLSGHYRNFDYNYDSWNQLLFSKYDCDVFLHTWDVVGNRKEGWQNDTNFSERLDKLKYTQDELKTKYGFTNVVVQDYKEPLEEFKEKSKRVRELRNKTATIKIVSTKIGRVLSEEEVNLGNRRITHLYSMWYKALKCFEMLEQFSTDYDLIIKCRPDIRLHDSFNLDDIDTEYINWPWYNQRQKYYSEPHDYYAVGNFKNMKIYNNLYNHMEEIESVLDIEKPVNLFWDNEVDRYMEAPGINKFLNPHTLLFSYIEHMGIPTKEILNHCILMRG
jgi:hypothetical protein